MGKYQIAVVFGSLRHDSFNRKLVNDIVKLVPPEFSFKKLKIGDLPLYNPDESVSRLKKTHWCTGNRQRCACGGQA